MLPPQVAGFFQELVWSTYWALRGTHGCSRKHHTNHGSSLASSSLSPHAGGHSSEETELQVFPSVADGRHHREAGKS